MKDYLRSIANQLKNYSESLDKSSILIDKPWALIDNEFEMQKLIFKKNKELILSKNGQVQIGKWDYFPEAKSLLIDRNVDKILCNEAFIDKGVMILKLDGTNNRFFILANENIIPDLDAIKYLKELRIQKLNILEKKLIDGKIIEVQIEETYGAIPKNGYNVSFESETVEDGKYELAEAKLDFYYETNPKFYEVKDSKILKILFETKYINPDRQEIIIQQQDVRKIKNGDYVYMYDNLIENGKINFSKSKNIIIGDGIVIRLEHKNSWARWFSMICNFGYDE